MSIVHPAWRLNVRERRARTASIERKVLERRRSFEATRVRVAAAADRAESAAVRVMAAHGDMARDVAVRRKD